MDTSKTISIKRLIFSKPVETIGWGGARVRNAIDDKDARIELDFATRTWRCVPKRGGAEVLEGPFENLTGWKRMTAEVETTPDPIDGEKEPQKPWKRKPAHEKLRKPGQTTAPVLEPAPAEPTATP